MQYTTSIPQPISLTKNTESQVYLLFSVALGLTVIGVYIGMFYAPMLMSTGLHLFFLFIQLGMLLTARLWMDKTPLNYLLFGIFPMISGFAITPYILYVLTGYANGGAILLNAFSATAFMALASAVFARTTTWNLGVLGKGLFFALIGLIVMSLLQFFIPALQTTQFELMLSGAGIVIFALFTAYDMQRIAHLGRMGENPFLLALSLYLDIFNLFLYILRFMLVLYGDRR